MGLSLTFDDLISHEVRSAIGERVIGSPEEPLDDGNIDWLPDWIEGPLKGGIQWVRNTFGGFVGFVWNKLKGLASRIGEFTAAEAWGAFVGFKEFILNFNFTQSDEAIDQTTEQLMQTIAAQLGSTVGCLAGQVVGGGLFALGYVATSKLIQLDPIAIKKGLKRQGKALVGQIMDDLATNLGALARTVAIQGTQALLLQAYKHGRNFAVWAYHKLKGVPDEEIEKIKESLYGPGAQPFIINEKVEDSIANIDNKLVRTFAENAWDEFNECFNEIGFVLADATDKAEEQEDMQEAVLGVERTIALTPDRTAPEETLVLAGNEESLKTQATTVMAVHQLLENRDLHRLHDRRKANELPAKPPKSTLTLKIQYYPLPDKPFSRTRWETEGKDENLWTEPDIKIPFVDPSKLTWAKIKRLAGGTVGFNFGKYAARGKLGGRPITVFGATEADAVNWLESLAELSEAELTGLYSGGRRRKTPNPRDNAFDEQYKTVRVYPAFATITAQRLTPGKGRASLQGEFSLYQQAIDLWTPDEPLFTKEKLDDAKRYHTPLSQLGIGFT
ncbi:MAG: hypothetical protein J7647_01680 [Cyanobacteria bacterium SBLK]|nr:hypothetical protein [Cyanobacteria bacterium SBLK]